MAKASARRKAAITRIVKNAAGLLMDHEDWTIEHALECAIAEEFVLHGDPDAQRPVGILHVKGNG